jgi:transposase
MTEVVANSADLQAALAKERHEKAELQATVIHLEQRIRLLEKALFGPRSERFVDTTANGQGVFEQLLQEAETLTRELEEQKQEEAAVVPAETASDPKKRQPRRSLEDLIPDNLPQQEIIVDIPEEDKICLETGEPLVKIGEERVRKLAFKAGSYFVKVYVYPKYASRVYPQQGVLQAPAVEGALRGSVYDESFIASVIFDKCGMHLPLFRQEERLHNLGIDISRQTLCYLYMQGANVLKPIYDEMKNDVLSRGVIFTDDTPVRLIVKGKGKTVQGRMWVYVGGGAGPPYRIFEFTIDRKKARPKEFLKGFKGYIHADAYKGYDDLFRQEGVFECACWMHVRRKIFEAEDAPPELRLLLLRLIRGIYRYERVLKGKPAETILAVRKERIAPLIDRIFSAAAEIIRVAAVLPASNFAKAIGYMQTLGAALKTFLYDARLKPDNGESERALRPLSIGRKNWIFAGSQAGGDATGILLSLVQSCRVLDIDPLEYLTDVLTRIGAHNSHRVHELLPHNWLEARKANS